MATLATFFRQPIALIRDRSERPIATNPALARTAAAVAEADPLALNGLPNDDIYFYCKRIDNSRLVRQADTQVKGEWTAIAGVCVAALLIGCMMIAPGVAGIMDSYKIQDLKREQAQLRNERRKLDVAEERLINAARLDALAPDLKLVRPGADQVIRLQPKNNHSFAMNGFKPR
jgi:hypothetical protein